MKPLKTYLSMFLCLIPPIVFVFLFYKYYDNFELLSCLVGIFTYLIGDILYYIREAYLDKKKYHHYLQQQQQRDE